MQRAGLRAQVGYRKPRAPSGEQHVVTPNRLERQCYPLGTNKAWVTDITYIKTHEGRLYLGAVMDWFSRQIIGWSMGSRITKELALDALLMAVGVVNLLAKCWFTPIKEANTRAMIGVSF